jgi:histone H3/H4
VCRNHIVWDATDVVEFSRKHTANVHDSLAEMRRIVEALVEKRDARRDGFVRVMRNAMETKLGDDADGALKVLADKGIGRTLAKKALEIATEQGRFTIFAVVDALTRLAGESAFAGERTESDRQAAKLLELAV